MSVCEICSGTATIVWNSNLSLEQQPLKTLIIIFYNKHFKPVNYITVCRNTDTTYNEQMHDTKLQKYENAHSKQCTVRLILTCCYDILKELEHRKLGWKVLVLKYDLGNSLSKEMWCKMADTNTIFDYILKKKKNACNMR